MSYAHPQNKSKNIPLAASIRLAIVAIIRDAEKSKIKKSVAHKICRFLNLRRGERGKEELGGSKVYNLMGKFFLKAKEQ